MPRTEFESSDCKASASGKSRESRGSATVRSEGHISQISQIPWNSKKPNRCRDWRRCDGPPASEYRCVISRPSLLVCGHRLLSAAAILQRIAVDVVRFGGSDHGVYLAASVLGPRSAIGRSAYTSQALVSTSLGHRGKLLVSLSCVLCVNGYHVRLRSEPKFKGGRPATSQECGE